MKTFIEIVNSKSVFLNDWQDVTQEKIFDYFEVGSEEVAGVKILFASYTYEDYSGDAFVLFIKDGKLFEVNGAHCSCYGLEGQWQPEEIILEELQNRLTVGTFGTGWSESGEFRNELREFLGIK